MSEHYPERLPPETATRMEAVLKKAEVERAITTS